MAKKKRATPSRVTNQLSEAQERATRILEAYEALGVKIGQVFIPKAGERYEFKVVLRRQVEDYTAGGQWQFVGPLHVGGALMEVSGTNAYITQCAFTTPEIPDCVLAREVK